MQACKHEKKWISTVPSIGPREKKIFLKLFLDEIVQQCALVVLHSNWFYLFTKYFSNFNATKCLLVTVVKRYGVYLRQWHKEG